ncbi:MAG: glycosyltransferase family 4 protein, partial [Chloroflexi bacterium]|nr:glycosyltransferase family 4 protein [Chloroflexota bacterium]
IDVLLRAVAGLKGEWVLRILGRGPQRRPLESLASKLEIEKRVIFDPPRSSTAMPDYYRQLDLLVLPSRTRKNWVEQFGRALIEAMACGVPALGSDAGEIPNVVGEAGLIVPEGDVQATRQAIQRLRDDADLRRRLGQLGRERVLGHYTQAQVAAATYQVYLRLVEMPPSGGEDAQPSLS